MQAGWIAAACSMRVHALASHQAHGMGSMGCNHTQHLHAAGWVPRSRPAESARCYVPHSKPLRPRPRCPPHRCARPCRIPLQNGTATSALMGLRLPLPTFEWPPAMREVTPLPLRGPEPPQLSRRRARWRSGTRPCRLPAPGMTCNLVSTLLKAGNTPAAFNAASPRRALLTCLSASTPSCRP
jgi:hypothetical protein